MEENKFIENLCVELNERKKNATVSSMIAGDDTLAAYYDGKEDAYNEVVVLLNSLKNG